MSLSPAHRTHNIYLQVVLPLCLFVYCNVPAWSQGGRYWDQNLNSEAALLSGAVVAGEGGIAAIYYNPATISEMTRDNLSLSANLFFQYFFKANEALGADFPPTGFSLTSIRGL